MKPSWNGLLTAAIHEVEETLQALPPELREAARALPIVCERRPGQALLREGVEADLLGLFVGDPRADTSAPAPLPPQILLFLENLWEFAEEDWDVFREEVQTTYLHELGHYLGLDEIELGDRGLE
jgi:predicted Zn-dependent protease with MMP-like domain